jgi:hypothetical protein
MRGSFFFGSHNGIEREEREYIADAIVGFLDKPSKRQEPFPSVTIPGVAWSAFLILVAIPPMRVVSATCLEVLVEAQRLGDIDG